MGDLTIYKPIDRSYSQMIELNLAGKSETKYISLDRIVATFVWFDALAFSPWMIVSSLYLI